MSNWIEKTFRSLTIGGVPAFRFLGNDTDNPEAQHFHKMVRDLPKNSPPTACIDYFMEHFGHFNNNQLKELHLDHEVTFVIQKLLPDLFDKIKKKQLIEKEMKFLNKAVTMYCPDQKTNQAIADFIFTIIETDDDKLLNLSNSFINDMIIQYPDLQSFFFRTDESIRLWNSCFIQNPQSNQIIGPIFIRAIQVYNIRNIDKVKSLMTAILNSFEYMKICEATAQNSIDFISFLIIKFPTGSFLASFFEYGFQFFSLLENFNCFSRFLIAQTTDPSIAWKYLNQICGDPTLKPNLLSSTIDVVYELRTSPQISLFTVKAFAQRMKEISHESQMKMFQIIHYLPISEKLNFFIGSIPTWETGVDTALLQAMVQNNDWGESIGLMISTFVLVDDFDQFKKNLVSDHSLNKLLAHMLSKVTPETELTIALYDPLISLSLDDIEVAINGIKILTKNIDPTMSTFPFISALQNNKVTDKIFDIFSSLAKSSTFFVVTFLQNNGVQALFPSLTSQSSLDFLATIAGNGPYDLLDSYIFENFENSKLAQLPEESLCRLMMGLRHDDKTPGLLRIPSLCPFVKNIPILSQFDRYVFGSVAIKYMESKVTSEMICQNAATYIDQNLALQLSNDAESLFHLTNPLYQHFPVFQCHIDSPHCCASIKLKANTTFWIYVQKVYDKTTILSTHFGEIILEADTIQFFNTQPILCTQQKWHMITILLSDNTFTQQNVTCYFDLINVVTQTTVSGLRATLGSETDTNAIYYFSGSFQSSPAILTMADLKQRYQNGPGAFCPTSIKMKQGFQFVPYRGIAQYLPRLGGEEFIFIKMLESTDSQQFNFYIQTAFNLLYLSLIEPEFFFRSLRYVLIKKKKLINKDLEPLLIHELTWHPEKKWHYNSLILLDYNILCENSFNFSNLPSVLNDDNNHIELFNYLLDAFIIFDLNSASENIFIDTIKLIVNKNQGLLKKILLSITAANFLDQSGLIELFYDDRMKRKQDMLYSIITDNMDMIPKIIPFDLAVDYLSTLRDDLALDLLQLIAKMTLVNPQYFNIDVFKKRVPLFTFLIKYESVWNVLFTFYTGSVADKIDDFAELELIRPAMTEDLLDLVCERMSYESTSTDIELLSIPILRSLITLIGKSQLIILDYFNQIQRLCTLGFDQYQNSPMPFSLEEDTMKPKLLSMIQSTFSSRDTIEKFSVSRISAFDPILFDETKKYLAKIEDFSTIENIIEESTESFAESTETKTESSTEASTEQIPLNQAESQILSRMITSSKPLPSDENIKRLLECENADTIARLASNSLVQKLNNSLSQGRRTMTRILINSADVLPKVAIEMHRKIGLNIVSSILPLNDDAYDFFIRFELTRIIEGWWDGFICDFFKSAFPRLCKSSKQLLISCLSRCSNIDDKLEILTYVCNLPFFPDLMSDSFYVEYLGLSLASDEMQTKTEFQYIKEIIMQTIPTSELTKAMKDGQLTAWAETSIDSAFYTNLLNDLKKSAISSSKTDRETRRDITKTLNHSSANLFQVQRIIDSFYIRKSYKFQFFIRFNKSNLEIDSTISKLFQKKALLRMTDHPTVDTFMVACAPHPFVVPQKLIPLTYNFPIPEKRSSGQLKIPQSHHFHKYPTVVSEISNEEVGPVCLEGWELPAFVRTAGLTYLLKSFFDSKTLIGCSMLSTPEVLPCVGAFSNDSFYVLMNANLIITSDGEEIALKSNSDMLCHLAAIENSIYGVYGPCCLFANHPTIRFKFSDIIIALPRRFVYTNTEIDIFLINGLHFTFIMRETDRRFFMSKIKTIPAISSISSGPLFASRLLAAGLPNVLKMWTNQEISTYDYLMYLNVLGGRSFNDLSQYPVFPWVLGDFTKNEPVLKRDLTKPMGAQTQARMDRFKINYEEAEPHCHYGTHYSHPAAVLHYMMRIEPFTLFNLHLHNGMDHVDRQFTSINDSWHSASESNQSDLKELIPEFYTFPVMFEDVNHIDFKHRTDGTSLNTVMMPPWGKDTFTFIWKMREALECPETSSHIGNWIDLIFGFKQRGQAAIDALNVFQPLTYDLTYDPTGIENEDWIKTLNFNINVNLHLISNTIMNNTGAGTKETTTFNSGMTANQIKGIIDTVNQFGQCPIQLFTTPHPECQRKEQYSLINRKFNITQLARVDSDIDTIQFDGDYPFFLPRFEHRIGPKMSLVRIWDLYIEQVFDKGLFTQRKRETDKNTTATTVENDDTDTTTRKQNANKIMVIKSLDAVSATAVSSDSLYLAVASKLGVINVFSCITGTPMLLNQLIAPSFDIKAIAISSQHGLVCAADKQIIMLFDYSTGCLMRVIDITTPFQNGDSSDVVKKSISLCDMSPSLDSEIPNFISDNSNTQSNQIEQIVFDDISNFIICMSQNGFSVYDLDLRFIAKTPKFPHIFTCIATCDSCVWQSKPFFATGHIGGFVYCWTLTMDIPTSPNLSIGPNGKVEFPASNCDAKLRTIQPTQIMQVGKSLITAVSIFAKNRAILAVDRTGNVSLASIIPIRSKFISPALFRNCSNCTNEIKPRQAYRCSMCGLYICKNCIASKMPLICLRCRDSLMELTPDQLSETPSTSTTPPPSPQLLVSASGSSFSSVEVNSSDFLKIEEEDSSDEAEQEQKANEDKVNSLNEETLLVPHKRNRSQPFRPHRSPQRFSYHPSTMDHARSHQREDGHLSPHKHQEEEDETSDSFGVGMDLIYRALGQNSSFKFSSEVPSPKAYRHSI